jgi:hypothetical protein
VKLDGSIDGHGGTQSGLRPDALSTIAARCPPSSSTTTLSESFSMMEARRLW